MNLNVVLLILRLEVCGKIASTVLWEFEAVGYILAGE